MKRFRAAVWKKLKGNNDSLGLSVTEERAIIREGGKKGKNQSGHSCGALFMQNSVLAPAPLFCLRKHG